VPTVGEVKLKELLQQYKSEHMSPLVDASAEMKQQVNILIDRLLTEYFVLKYPY
jgi:hypothetical protein